MACTPTELHLCLPSGDRRCLTQNVLKIVELQVNQSHSPTNLMTNHMHRKHLSRICHYNQDRIPFITLQSCVLLVYCFGYPCEPVQISHGPWLGLPDLLLLPDEARARVCSRHVAQYLRWTLHFALFYEPVQEEGDYSYQAVSLPRIQSRCVAIPETVSCCFVENFLPAYG